MSFTAKFASVCFRCGEPIVKGDRIESVNTRSALEGRGRGFRHAAKTKCDELIELASSYTTQAQEMRMETFAAEAMMGMAPGTTEGWYDEPDYPDLSDQREPW